MTENGLCRELKAVLPLRFAQADCYRLLLEELAAHHLHAYDVQADAAWQGALLTISLRYGEGLARERERVFAQDEVERLNSSLSEFFREAAADCRKAMIADYYKLMKP